MKCETCVAEGEPSTVTPSPTEGTCAGWSPFYDSFGAYHSHDPNVHTGGFRCSRGHKWSSREIRPCMVRGCDYGGKVAT